MIAAERGFDCIPQPVKPHETNRHGAFVRPAVSVVGLSAR